MSAAADLRARRRAESTEPERASDPTQEVLYLQSQNGNVYSPYGDEPEYASLQADVPSTLPWASEALGALVRARVGTVCLLSADEFIIAC